MKRFLLKLLPFLIFITIIQVVLPALLDPFNVFHADNIRNNGVHPNKDYIKMRYIVKNPDKFNSFIFGSSRVGALHNEKIVGEKCYNMTTAGGIPAVNLANIKTMLENGVHIKKVYIGIDTPFTSDPNSLINQPMVCPYEYLANDAWHFYNLYLGSEVAFQSLKYILGFSLGDLDTDFEHFYSHGWWVNYGQKSVFDWTSSKATQLPKVRGHKNIGRALNDINNIKSLCSENNIELVIFTNPLYKIRHIQAIEIGYLDFLKGLAEISEFYNFSGLNDITTNNANYLETSHYRAEVGDLIIDVICNGKKFDELYKQGFGVKINHNNIDELIALLNQQWQDYKNAK